ncbi:MAG: hypothetical protein K1X53_02945 [Candidatus Sumerlaeaceae bacterium]|nr:hypothetical protein [Candidatus Sumerlaeaceae bacterium]
MTLKKGQQKFTKEEIIEILKRNVNLFRDEEEFVEYIVELTLYLVEHRLQTTTKLPAGESPAADETGGIILKRKDQFLRTRKRDTEIQKVLRKHITKSDATGGRSDPSATGTGAPLSPLCPMCGAPTKGKRMCPNCGSFIH